MQTSEFEYYLLSELIGMPDRVLANQIELLIWARSPIPNEPILQKFLDLLEASGDEDNFADLAREYVKSCPVDWTVQIIDSDGMDYAGNGGKPGPVDYSGFGWDRVIVGRRDSADAPKRGD